MKKAPITKKQLAQVADIINSNPWQPAHKWRFITHHDNESYKTWDKTHDLLPRFIVNDRYACFNDCGGIDIVVDLKTRDFRWQQQGIFEHDWFYLSDYYGYPDGAFFYLVK